MDATVAMRLSLPEPWQHIERRRLPLPQVGDKRRIEIDQRLKNLRVAGAQGFSFVRSLPRAADWFSRASVCASIIQAPGSSASFVAASKLTCARLKVAPTQCRDTLLHLRLE